MEISKLRGAHPCCDDTKISGCQLSRGNQGRYALISCVERQRVSQGADGRMQRLKMRDQAGSVSASNAQMDKAVAWTKFSRCVVLANAAGWEVGHKRRASRYPSCLRPGITVLVLYLERRRILMAKSEKWGLLLFYNQIGPESDSESRSNWKR